MPVVIGIVLILYGVASLFAPREIWELQERMRYKDSDREPSDISLVMIRLSGAAVIAITLFALAQSCSSMTM